MQHDHARRSSRTSFIAVCALGTLAGMLYGCDGSESSAVEPETILAGEIAMQVVAGAGQVGVAGEPLPDPLVVKVLKPDGSAKSNQIVNFVVVAGGGSVFAGASLTNAEGMAQEIWTLGSGTGVQRVEARAVDPSTGKGQVYAVFEATTGTPGTKQVIVTAPSGSLESARSMQLDASVVDGSGRQVGGKVVWTSSNPGRAVVSDDGLVRAIAPGQVTIGAQSGEASGATTLEVFDPALPGTPVFSDGMESGSLAGWQDGVNASKHTIVTDPTAARTGSRVLRVDYPAGGDGGWLTRFLSSGHDAVHVRYWVRLAPEWRGGTSLVGVYGSRTDDRWSAFGKYGTCPTGTNYFNTFLTAGGGDPGSVGFLTFHQDMGAPCEGSDGNAGTTYANDRTLTPGQWHRVEIQVRANEPGSSDGEQRMWIDGELKGTWTGLRFRDSYILMLNAVQLGFGSVIGAPVAQHLFVDDVEISYLDVQSGADEVASVTVSPATVSVEAGSSIQLAAELRNSAGASLDGHSVSWTSSNTGVATVDGNGRVSASTSGSTTVTATSGGVTGTASVTVTAAAPAGTASVELGLNTLRLTSLGESRTVGVTATDANGNALAASDLSWSSTATNVATVNTNGSVTAASNGTTRIIAVFGSAADTATITVDQEVASVSVTPSTVDLDIGKSFVLTGKAVDARGVVVQGASLNWTSSNLGIATVDGSGRVTAVSAGSTTVGVTSAGHSDASTITVSAGIIEASGWPNQPAGFVSITDQPWDALSSNGWGHMNRASESRIVTDASAPHSPSSVLEHLYPAGFTNYGAEPAVDWFNLGGATEIFVGFWWKPSNPWQGHSTGINKVLFAWDQTNSKNVVLTMRGAPGGPYHLEAFPEGHPAASDGYLSQNRTRIPVRLGEWHRVEMRVSIPDGVIQWWVDGTLVGDYSGLNLSSGGFGELQIAPTWGGLGGSDKQQTDYFRYDHVFVSEPGG